MSSSDAEQKCTDTYEKMTEQLQESIKKYDSVDPKDRLILYLASTVDSMDQEIKELRAAHVGWVVEIDEMRQRLEITEEQLVSIKHKIARPPVKDALDEFEATAKQKYRKKSRQKHTKK